MPAGVMPTSTRDQTAEITARGTASQDALTRLFYSLMARREERMSERAMRVQERQDEFNRQNTEWSRRLEEGDRSRRQFATDYNLYGDRTNPKVSPLSPGVVGSTGVRPQPRTAAPVAPPIPPAPKTIPGATVPMGPDTSQFTPQPGKRSDLPQPDASNTMLTSAQDDTDEGDNGQLPANFQLAAYNSGGVPPPRQSQAGATLPRPFTPVSTSATLPRGGGRGGGGRGNADMSKVPYPPIRDDIKAAWAATEKKYGLPPGVLQTALGVTNEKGYNPRTELRSSDGMGGWFGTTAEIRHELGVDGVDTNDPIAMGEVAGMNMRRNIDAYHRLASTEGPKSGVSLPKIGNTVADVPNIIMLNQMGPVAGPRALALYHLNPTAPLSRAIPPTKTSDGVDVDPGRLLIHSGIPSNATVQYFHDTLVSKKVLPLHAETVRNQDMPDAGADASDQGAAPRPPQDVPTSDAARFLQSRGGNVTNLNPEYTSRLAYVLQQAEAATGGQAKINELYRSPEVQAQYRSNYIHAPVTYKGVRYLPQKRGGLAAPPGQSRHQSGEAGDVSAEGPVLSYLHRNPQLMKAAGLEFLPPHLNDPVHIQLSRRGELPPLPNVAVAANPPTTTAQAATQQPAQTSPLSPTPPAVAAAPTATPPAASVKRPSLYGNVNTFGAPVSPPIVTADMLSPSDERTAIATNTGGDVPLPRPRPPVTATAAVPDAASAAANEPTPQTAQPTTQVTQAPPVKPTTTQPTPVDPAQLPNSGYTIDDMDEHGPQSVVDSMKRPQFEVGKALDRFDASKMLGSAKEAADAVAKRLQAIPAYIRENYSAGQLDPTKIQQYEEDVAARSAANPAPQTRFDYSPGQLDPNKIKAYEQDVANRTVANPPPTTQQVPATIPAQPTSSIPQAPTQPTQTQAVTNDPSLIQRIKDALFNSSQYTQSMIDALNEGLPLEGEPNYGPRSVKTTPIRITPQRQAAAPLYPPSPKIPPLDPATLAKPVRPGQGVNTGGLVIQGGTLMPAAPGQGFMVDPNTGRILPPGTQPQELPLQETTPPPPDPEYDENAQ